MVTAKKMTEDDGYQSCDSGDPEPFGVVSMEYGKYKDKWLKDIPFSYIQWLLDTRRCSGSLYYELRNDIHPTKTVPGTPSPTYVPPDLAQAHQISPENHGFRRHLLFHSQPYASSP